jgi:DtxR family Mn-dependent transcriptional regulator
MRQTEQLSASLEDYLEAIFNIISEKGAVRAKDIAKYLGVKAGSVTVALKALARSEHINYQPYEVITLTSKGLDRAKGVIHKHEILKDFFVEILGADSKNAEERACKIEHVIGNKLSNRLLSFTEFIKKYPQYSNDMIDKFHSFYNKNGQFCHDKVVG